MTAAPQHLDGTQLAEAYGEFDHALRISRAKVGYILSMLLVPAGVTLDYFVYPHLSWPIFKARIMCVLLMAPCLWLVHTSVGRKYIRLMDKPCAILPSLAICWMIYLSEGVSSPYYAGLNLVMVAVCLVMPYTARDALVFCAIVLVCYAITCVVYLSHSYRAHDELRFSWLFNNLYFIVLTSIVCVTACYYSSRRRFDDFRLRHELQLNNYQLEVTLKKLKETEVQLVQSEKMNALGKLSAGLLHEINNPLNFTFMALQSAQQDIGDNIEVLETLKDIGEGMTRIRTVVSDLRAFAYPSTLAQSDPFEVRDALTTASRLISHELGDILIQSDELAGVRATGVKTQIVHVFMNTLVNAVHAVRADKSGRPKEVKVTCVQRSDRLVITVHDNGTGVKRENLPRLCEPFFTTKEVGQGMGLGLSISHTIVKNHGGELVIASEEGQWTDVSFDLPLAVAGSKS